MSRDRLAAVAACSLIAAGVVSALLLTGSPGHARTKALDDRRAADVALIADALRERYTSAGDAPVRLPQRLPHDLGVERADGSDATRDPVSRIRYRYARDTATTYRLCATFALASDASPRHDVGPHPAGPACYRYDVTDRGRSLPPAAIPQR
jgi:hypothetical protein